ncbi:MAG: hypothetical protein M1816_007395 [Peltula sp. TS41687]|nr:MAG: hypothetical protein M1816_007395 [Peltula sp. TS41687]
MASTATDGPVHGTAVPDLGPAIEPAEEEPYDDTDSALGDGLQSSTTSIASSVLNYKYSALISWP